jgi:predicted Zn-dependent peptidase
VDKDLAELQKVTAADVQRVAKTYFRPENRTVVHMLPAAMKPGAQEKQP